VLGLPASGKTTSMRRLLDAAAAGAPTPSDWCYVHSFADPYRPRPWSSRLPEAVRARQNEREPQEAHARLVRDGAAAATRLLVGEVKDALAGLPAGHAHLTRVEEDFIAHAEQFRGDAEERPALPFSWPCSPAGPRERSSTAREGCGAAPPRMGHSGPGRPGGGGRPASPPSARTWH
jgi:hypothetical protein